MSDLTLLDSLGDPSTDTDSILPWTNFSDTKDLYDMYFDGTDFYSPNYGTANNPLDEIFLTPPISPTVQKPRRRGRPRGSVNKRVSDCESPDKLSLRPLSQDVIEKRYRTKLRSKFGELIEAVPTLKAVNESSFKDDIPAPLAAARNIRKNTVLSKAVEYIHHLERENKRLRILNAGTFT